MGSKKTKETSSTTVNVPAWLDDKNKALISRVDALSQSPYEAYTGERVAGFTPDQLNAFNLIRGGQGDAAARGEVANQGVLDLYKRAQGPTSEDLQGLMNPYLEQVLGLTKRQEADSQAEAMARLKQESGLAGAFGGSRFALEQSLQQDQNQRRLSDIDYTGRFDAYNNAMNQYNQGTNVLSESIGRAIDVSNNDPSMQYAQTLLGSGSQQQVQNQTVNDVNYQDFLTEQQYPYQQAQWAQSFLQPYTDAYKGSTTNKTSKEVGGGLQQAAGLAGTVAAAYFTGGASLAAQGAMGAMKGGGGGGSPSYSGSLGSNPAIGTSSIKPIIKPPTPYAFNRFKDGGAVVEGYANGGEVTAADEEFMKTREAIRGNNAAALLAPASALPADVVPNATGYVSDPDAVIATDEEIPAMPLLPNGAEDMSYLLDSPKPLPKDSSFYGPPTRLDAQVAAAKANRKPEAFVPPVVATPATAAAQTVAQQMNVVPDYAMPELKVTEDYIKQLIGESKKPVDDGNYQKYNFLGYEGQIYMPMFKAGLAMMASDGDFFEALAAGGNAFAGQLEQSSKSKSEKEAERLKALGLASEAERGAMQTQSNRIQVNKMNSDKILDPYSQALKEAQATLADARAIQLADEIKFNRSVYGNNK